MKISQPLLAGGAALLLLSAAATVAAQQDAQQDAQAPAVSPDLDADALAALEKMGDTLRSRSIFELNADITTEDVLDTGEKLQFAGRLHAQARRPDRLRLSAVSDTRDRQIYYDGKSLTVYAPRLGVYGSFAAPATIAQTLRIARERYDIEMPLADLFTWGTDESPAAKLTSGFLVRPETIGGRLCNHYAFRQENADWQIWIAADQPALPCKLVITNTEDDSKPQYSAVLRWSFPDTIADDVFAFSPPAASNQIVIIDVASKQASGDRK